MTTVSTSLSRPAAAALALCLGLGLAAGSAHAEKLLSHEKALEGQPSIGDPAGYPITIAIGGVYKLTSDLVVPPNTLGLHVGVAGVTIDLNGHTIRGPVTCAQEATTQVVSCTPSGVGRGVFFSVGPFNLRNGTIRGFAEAGLHINEGVAGTIDGVTLTMNGGNGLLADSGTRLRLTNVVVDLNKQIGMHVQGTTLIDGAQATRNGDAGIWGVGFRTTVIDSTATLNRGRGFIGVSARGTSAQDNKAGNTLSVSSMGGNLSGITPY